MVPIRATSGFDEAPQSGTTLLARLVAMLQRAESIPVATYEEVDADALSPLVRETCAILKSANETVGAILEHYDEIAERRASSPDLRLPLSQPGELLSQVERSMDEDVGIQRIQNLAFIARIGLKARLASLEGLGPPNGKWEIISTAGSSLREVLKALGALAVAVSAHEGLPQPPTFYVTELERSLAVRRAYRIFYGDVDPQHEPPGSEVGRRLRRAANAIAKLAGRPIYASMRVHDRHSLRTMQRRLASFLSTSEGDTRAREAAGLHLFQDLASLAGLMLGVNERAELCAHDARLLAEVVPALEFDGAGVAPALQALRALYGRDPELDAMLGAAALPTATELVAKLRQLQIQLASRTPSIPAPRPSAASLPDGDDFL